jgi:hypothetical protein
MRLRGLLALIATFVLLVGAAPLRPDYAEGQVWEYKTRPGEEESLIKIQKIEGFPEADSPEKVYHISIVGLHYRNSAVPGKAMHLPVSRKTLDASLTRLSTKSPEFPDYREGYQIWRENSGGVFDISLAELAGMLDNMVSGERSKP